MYNIQPLPPAPRPSKRGRNVHFINLSMDREAIAIMREEAPSSKALGHFLSRLIYEHRARQEERQKLARESSQETEGLGRL